ncbi:DMT family transporter [Pikeienuella piscinae]|uniref:DMT family transporter n=1 Tax=Pikeienuella piscinae TaxID=2748098 RepID=A0A7L5BXQ6_9RHOB|nr:DMT family transporter [Pikeienuella piscinae]QIE54674.1 DMT family transporter [Pikeienuella piscinae]
MTSAPGISVRSWVDLGLLALIWGAIFLFVALALRELTPFWIVFHRVFWAALLLWGVVLWRGLAIPRRFGTWAAFAVMGALNNAIPFMLITWGQKSVESGLASILNGAAAFFGILVAALLLRDERLTARRIAGVLTGIAGVVVIVGPEALTGFDIRALGQLAILGATLSYAFAGVWGKLRLNGLAPVVSAAGMLSGSSVIAGALALFVEGAPVVPQSAVTVGALAYASVIGTATAYILYFRVLATAGSGNLLLVTICMPPIAIALGALVLGERLAPGALIGAGLIALGLLIIDGRALGALRRLAGQRRAA